MRTVTSDECATRVQGCGGDDEICISMRHSAATGGGPEICSTIEDFVGYREDKGMLTEFSKSRQQSCCAFRLYPRAISNRVKADNANGP